MQIALLKESCGLALKELHRWMAPEKVISFKLLSLAKYSFVISHLQNITQKILYFQVKTMMTTFPSSAEIVPEPLGVVLVISAWNFPFCMLRMDPLYPFSFFLRLHIACFHTSSASNLMLSLGFEDKSTYQIKDYLFS